MAVYYVGPSSAGAADGSSWANRLGTLNSAEDKPVVAGDTVYVGPGVYRELLTCDVSGSSGSPITYIADVDGSHTDGVGGIVRITGSDNDQATARANCITAPSRNYRTFRGFWLGHASGAILTLTTSCSNWIIEDCIFGEGVSSSYINVGGAGTNNTIRRCQFFDTNIQAIAYSHTSVVDNAGHLVENCLFAGVISASGAVGITRIGGITIKNCTFRGFSLAIRVNTAPTSGQTITVNNNIFHGGSGACLTGTATTEIIEDYNTFFNVATARSNTNTGSNSVTYPALFQPLILLAGFKRPWQYNDLSQYSQVRAKAGTGEASDGIYGMARPATSAKKSWGAAQYVDTSRETTTIRTGAASLKLADAGRQQMFVPTTNVSTIFSVYVQWEADYTGTKPQMVIKQPGQSDTTVTATGSSGSWELLTTTLTPAASPGYVIVELVSNNAAVSTNFDVFFDDFTRTP